MNRKRPVLFRLYIKSRPLGETYDEMRQRMIDETSRYIEWGLAHPERIVRIPSHPVGQGEFPRAVSSWFWEFVFREEFGPPGL